MSSLRSRLVTAMVVAIGLSLAGCSASQTGGSATPTGGTVETSASLAPSLPTPTAANPTASPNATPPSASPPSASPPSAELTVEGADPVVGQLGSFTWAGAGSDSPWLPGAPVRLGAGESMTVDIDTSNPVVEWTATRVDPGTTDGSGGVELGSGSGPIVFNAPEAASGSWSVQVQVRFGDDLGSAAYYWLLTID